MPSAPQEEGSVSADDSDGETSSTSAVRPNAETARSEAGDHVSENSVALKEALSPQK